MDPVFRLNNCWKYKDESIVAKIKEFIAENNVKDKLTVSFKVAQTLTARFSEKYEGSLWSHVSKTIIKLEGEKNWWCDELLGKGNIMKIKVLEKGFMPKKGREGDAAWDVFLPEDVVLKKKSLFCLDSGICVELPKGHAAMFVPRSSSAKKDISISDCLIDENYRGEVHIIGKNESKKTYKFKRGDRIASLLVFPIYTGDAVQVEELSDSNRGTSWNGSSGK